jgi:MPBQ/MSBQ methyltransferase
MDAATFAAQYDATISEPRMRALYGTSGYFNVGYWTDGTADLVAACDRLVDEVIAPIGESARTIVDVGCGLGAGTRRVSGRFPRALVLGVNISVWQLGQARGRGVRSTAAMDAAQLALGTGTADAVTAMESPQHFDTRADFFAEALRVLRPGGVLSVADMLFRDAEPIGPWMLPRENHVGSLEDYEQLLRDTGFENIVVRDITARSWTPYCAAMRGVFAGHDETLDAIEESLAFYVLATARRRHGRLR